MRSKGWAAHLGVTLVGALTFALAVWAGRRTVEPGTDLSLIWPAAGVAAVWFAVQRGRPRFVLDVGVLAVITFTINLVTGAGPLLALAFVVANLVQLAVLGWALRLGAPVLWGAGGTEPLTRVRQFGALVAATVTAALAGASIGPTAVGLVDGVWSWTGVLLWVTRNAASILLLLSAGMLLRPRIHRLRAALAGPASTRAFAHPPAQPSPMPRSAALPPPLPRMHPVRAAELVALLTATVVLYVGVFVVVDGLPLAFPLLVTTIWVAFRFDTAVTALHSVLAAVLAVTFTLAHHGPFAGVANDQTRAIVVQLFIGMLAVVGMMLALSRDERDALLLRVRRQADESRALADETQLLAQVSSEVFTAEQPREVVCRAAAQLAGADGAYLFEPDGHGSLVPVAVAGADVPPLKVPLDVDASLTARVYLEAVQEWVPDARQDPRVNPALASALNAVSGLWQPVLLPGQDRATGVLLVFWRRPVERLPAHVPAMLTTLAAEAAAALERSDLLARLADAAERDFLTGLRNRRGWDERTAAEVARAERSGQPLTFVMIDLDHFKRYNDSLGHKAGDLLLREFAAAASGCLREIDLLARWGGEEFVACLPDCSLEEGVRVAERLRQVVPRGQTCTIGLASWAPGQTVDAVLARADVALYEGKAGGRNRVVVADAPVGQTVATEPESTR